MRYFILALVAFASFNAFAGTNIQYQAHAPAGTDINSKFSIYIADSSFDENSHLNSNALWYRENVDIEINNGIINYLIENVDDNILVTNYGKKLFVYAYVNGVTIGRLQIRSVPYSLLSTYSLEAAEAKHSENADNAKVADSSRISKHSLTSNSSVTSNYSDSSRISNYSNTSGFADTARAAGKATLSDLATYSTTAAHSAKSDTAQYAVNSGHSFDSDTSIFALNAAHSFDADTSVFAYDADHANFASTSAFATNSARSTHADTADVLIDNTIEHRNFKTESVRLSSLEGSSTAAVGSYAIRGTNGISWEVNPQDRTNNVQLYTAAPTSIPGNTRWIVSRVAVDYNITSPTSPVAGQLVSIFNGSTANQVTVRAITWNIDTALDYTIWPGQSRTLWFNGTNWVVVQ
jgi:hypothetical protein